MFIFVRDYTLSLLRARIIVWHIARSFCACRSFVDARRAELSFVLSSWLRKLAKVLLLQVLQARKSKKSVSKHACSAKEVSLSLFTLLKGIVNLSDKERRTVWYW